MGIRKIAACLVLAISWRASAVQQPVAPNPEFDAERQAANANQLRVEKLFSAGERGPQSEPCRLMDSYYLHLVKAAAAAGANTRIAGWLELTPQEQDAVKQKMPDVIWARSMRMRQIACRANS